MDAVNFFKAKSRMCDSFKVCCDCPLNEINSTSDVNCFNKGFEEEAITIVQRWAEEHPIKTRQSEFLKMFPNAIQEDGILDYMPCAFDTNISFREARCKIFNDCCACKKDFWLAELPEE